MFSSAKSSSVSSRRVSSSISIRSPVSLFQGPACCADSSAGIPSAPADCCASSVPVTAPASPAVSCIALPFVSAAPPAASLLSCASAPVCTDSSSPQPASSSIHAPTSNGKNRLRFLLFTLYLPITALYLSDSVRFCKLPVSRRRRRSSNALQPGTLKMLLFYISLKVEHSVPALLFAPPPLISTCSAWHL